MKKLTYMPIDRSAASSINFSSTKGSAEFPAIGSEIQVEDEVFEALKEENSEFGFCLKQKIIIAENLPNPESQQETIEETPATPTTTKKATAK